MANLIEIYGKAGQELGFYTFKNTLKNKAMMNDKDDESLDNGYHRKFDYDFYNRMRIIR